MHVARLLSLMVFAAVVVLRVQAQPAPPPVKVEPAKPPLTLRLPLPSRVISLDPHLTPGSGSLPIIADIYEGLMQWLPGEPATLAPCLAKDFPVVSADGLTWTFKLRSDARFHNSACFEENKGRAPKASDVVASFKRLAECSGERGNWYWLIRGWIAGLDEYATACAEGDMAAGGDAAIEGLAAPDDTTFVLKLKKPCAAMSAMLAHPALSVLPAEAMEHFGRDLATRAVGTGPYRLNAVSANKLYVLKRVDDWRGEKPYFERVTYANALSEQALFSGQWARYLAGPRDLARIEKDRDLQARIKDAKLELQHALHEGVSFLAFNMADPVFGARDADGKGLRKAISSAINRDVVIEAVFESPVYAKAADQLLPPGCEFAEVSKDAQWAEFDLAKAKKALDATKFKGGKDPATGKPLSIKLACDTGNENLAAALTTLLAEIGIDVETEFLSTSELYEAMDRGDGGMFLYGWNLDFPLAQNFLQLFDSANIGAGGDNRNCAHYSAKEFDEMYAQLQALAMTPANAAKRKDLTKKICDLLLEDRVVVPLYIQNMPMLRSTALSWPKLPQSAFDEVRFIKAAK